MTEWDAPDYAQISALQKAMAEEVLALLHLKGSERVLDVGCGDGRVTAEVVKRVPHGAVVGVDSSVEMIKFAQSHWGARHGSNMRFEVGDARRLPFREEFDLVVSFNALHWIPEQEQALASIHAAMKTSATAQLRLVPAGPRKSLEDVLLEIWQSSTWAPHFQGFHQPYLHLSAEQYKALAEQTGLNVLSEHVGDKSWDFGSRRAFFKFAEVTFVEWTHMLQSADDKNAFTNDVLDRYASVAGDEKTFKFYQMDTRVARQ